MSGAAPSSNESPELHQLFSELSTMLQVEDASVEDLLENLEQARCLDVDRNIISKTKVGDKTDSTTRVLEDWTGSRQIGSTL